MKPSQRIRACRLIEKMNRCPQASNNLGMINRSTFHGTPVGSGAYKPGKRNR